MPLTIDADHLPEGDAKATAVREMFDAIAPRYDLVNRIMTFRMDVGWRKRTVRRLQLRPGSIVADLACGTGDFCRELRSSRHEPIGFDLSYGMLASGRTDAPLAQADILRAMGCDTVQGYIFAAPMFEDEFLAWIGNADRGSAKSVA